MNSLQLPNCNVSDLVQAQQDLKSRDEFKTRPFPTGQQWCFIPVSAASVFCGLCLSPLPSCRSVCLTCLLNRSFRLHRQSQALLPRRPPTTALCLSGERIPEALQLRGLRGLFLLGGSGLLVFLHSFGNAGFLEPFIWIISSHYSYCFPIRWFWTSVNIWNCVFIPVFKKMFSPSD